MVVRVAVPIEAADRLEIGALALRRGRAQRAPSRRPRALTLSVAGLGGIPKRVPLAHGDAPIRHRATRLRVGDRRELLQGLLVPERMQGPDGLVEPALVSGEHETGKFTSPIMTLPWP